MTTFTVSTTPQTVASAGIRCQLTNGGTINVFLRLAGRSEIVYPGASLELTPDVPVTAVTNSGTATLTVGAPTTPVPNGGGRANDLLPDAVTYNGDGTVATSKEGNVTTTYTYNADGTVATESRLGRTKTYQYDASGNVTGSVVA